MASCARRGLRLFSFRLDFGEPLTAAQVRVSNPTKAFEQVVLKFAPKPITFAPGIHPSAIVGSSVRLGERVSIQPHAVIEDGSEIGDDTIIGAGSYIGHDTTIGATCMIYPLVTIRERSRIGSRVIIHSGAVDWCGWLRFRNGRWPAAKDPAARDRADRR